MLRIALNRGILNCREGVYSFAEDVTEGPKCNSIPEKQREILLQLMSAFPEEKFTWQNASEVTGIKHSSIGYYLNNLTQRGILIVEYFPRNIKLYSFSGDVHAIFEATNETDGKAEFKQLPAVEKEAYSPLKGTEEAG